LAHRRYTRRINFREKWRGYLWQSRLASFVTNEPHLFSAPPPRRTRYRVLRTRRLCQATSPHIPFPKPRRSRLWNEIANPFSFFLSFPSGDDRGGGRCSRCPSPRTGRIDRLVKVAPLLATIGDWRAFLDSAMPEQELAKLPHHTRTSRPLGDRSFVERLEEIVGRGIAPKKRGPKPKQRAN
jgi:putative transposase